MREGGGFSCEWQHKNAKDDLTWCLYDGRNHGGRRDGNLEKEERVRGEEY
jgi:hypothetical protein